MCGGCLSVAYTLTGVRGNDDDERDSHTTKSSQNSRQSRAGSDEEVKTFMSKCMHRRKENI